MKVHRRLKAARHTEGVAFWLFEKLHISWHIAAWCAGFVGGTALALLGGWLAYPWLAVCMLPVVLLRWRVLLILSLLLGAVWGNWHGVAALGGQAALASYVGQSVELSGVVREDGTFLENGEVRLQLSGCVVDGKSVEGSVWVSVRTQVEIARSDRVTLRGEVGEGFGSFVVMMPRAGLQHVERLVPGDVGRVVRDWFADAVRRAIPEPQASLGVGFLTGQKSSLPQDMLEQFQIAGLTHIVVASGYNLTILVRLARRLFVKVSKYLSLVTAGAMIAAFLCVTGLSPSMTRAGVVSGISLVTWAYGRSAHPLVLLAVVAALTVAWQPSYVWGDLGWQLSFAAFFGVMVVAPLLQQVFFGLDPPGTLRQVLGETVAAHIVTLPIVVATFGVVSNVAVIANLLIVPLVPLAMLGTFVAGVLSLSVPQLAFVVAAPTEWLLAYMTAVSDFLANLPWAQSEVAPPAWVYLAYGVILLGGCWAMTRLMRIALARENIVV